MPTRTSRIRGGIIDRPSRAVSLFLRPPTHNIRPLLPYKRPYGLKIVFFLICVKIAIFVPWYIALPISVCNPRLPPLHQPFASSDAPTEYAPKQMTTNN